MSKNTTAILFLFIVALILLYFALPSTLPISHNHSINQLNHANTQNSLSAQLPLISTILLNSQHLIPSAIPRTSVIENMTASSKIDKNALTQELTQSHFSTQHQDESYPTEVVVVVDTAPIAKASRRARPIKSRNIRSSQIPRNNGLQFNPIVKARFYDKETGAILADKFGAIDGAGR